MNKLDSALVASALKDAGFALTEKAKDADVVLINTCSVRRHAEDRVLSHLGHLKHIKETRPELIVAVIGCMAQRLGARLLDHEAVDIVCGPAQIPQIPGFVKQTLENKTKILSVTENIRQKPQPALRETKSASTHGVYPERNRREPRTTNSLDDFELAYDSDQYNIPNQAFVRVMRGCNNFCSYCVVPYVRGPEVSRPPEAIIEQIKKLANQGVKQITLLGQTINSYNWPAPDKTYRLADLLHLANAVEGIKWIRFITSYPLGFDESILHAMADLPKVCPYLHIPAQSGSDKILKAMNRRYTAGDYLDLLAKARDIVDGIAIAGDFIVGFPGETEQDFAATVDLVKKAEYKNCFVFKYSPRPGTRADDKLADSVSAEVKKQRNIELLEVQNQISGEYNKHFLGQTLEVLAEGPSKKPHLDSAEPTGRPQLVGRTATDYIVVFNGPLSLAGRFAKVKITKTSPLTLFAKLLSL
jgi:tRNA-2-methylthio-N6-dimethylallyladenosine synthase